MGTMSVETGQREMDWEDYLVLRERSRSFDPTVVERFSGGSPRAAGLEGRGNVAGAVRGW